MRVLISALALRAGGGQTHLYNILKYLPEDEGHEFFLLAPISFKEPENLPRLRRLFPKGLKWIEYPLLRLLWEAMVLPRLRKRLRIDAVFAPGGIFVGPKPKDCKIITACQNMMPFDHIQRAKYPWGYMRLRTKLLEAAFLKCFSRSDLVIFISNFAKNKVLELLGDAIPAKSIVASPGVNPRFILDKMNPLPKPEWLPEAYILYVSTIDVYKAQLEIVRGFQLYLTGSPHAIEKLVLIGSEYKPYAKRVRDEISRLKLNDRIVIKGLIPYRTLPAVYQHAQINIFASECENCPNILLEAMASGRPVLASNLPPIPEFGGSAVEYFNPNDPADFCEKLSALSGHKENIAMSTDIAIRQVLKLDNKKSTSLIWDSILDLMEDAK